MTTTAVPATVELDVRNLRRLGGAMLAAAAAWPLLPAGAAIPCGVAALTGVPCPLCGMTRSVVATVHLRFGDALATNPAGILAVVVAVALLVLGGARPALVVPRWGVPVGLAGLWACQLLRLPFT